jgi:probable HAF family extracellular repeat protein
MRLFQCSTFVFCVAACFAPVGAASGIFGFVDNAGVFNSLYAISPSTFGSGARGVNNAGQIVGWYQEADGHGFLDVGGLFTSIDDPLGYDNSASGINNSGQIVGTWVDGNTLNGYLYNGYLYSGGVFTPVIDPSATTRTWASGINDSGQICGSYEDASGFFHGFVDTGGSFSTVDDPLGISTLAEGINNAGEIVGYYYDSTWHQHGYLDNGGTFTTIDDPLGVATAAMGINNTGQIVGWYQVAAGYPDHGFLYNGSSFTTIDVPLANGGTEVLGVNDAGVIVGEYTVDTGDYYLPEPSTFAPALMALALLNYGRKHAAPGLCCVLTRLVTATQTDLLASLSKGPFRD